LIEKNLTYSNNDPICELEISKAKEKVVVLQERSYFGDLIKFCQCVFEHLKKEIEIYTLLFMAFSFLFKSALCSSLYL